MSTPRKAKITFISAGAGSGKTHRLTELLQEELTSRGARPAGVIATTFTRKAAAELRERVRAQLLQQGCFALANAMGQPNDREAALITFLVSASGMSFLGLSAAFWGLLFGIAAHLLLSWRAAAAPGTATPQANHSAPFHHH